MKITDGRTGAPLYWTTCDRIAVSSIEDDPAFPKYVSGATHYFIEGIEVEPEEFIAATGIADWTFWYA